MEEIKQFYLAKDKEHLNLLVIFHWIFGVLRILFSLIGVVYLHLLRNIFNNPNFYSNFHDSDNLQFSSSEFIGIVVTIVKVTLVIAFFVGIANIISAQFIKQRVKRTFSIVVACIDCIFIPFGTILGVFTLIVLFRNSVLELYDPAK